MTEQKSPFDNVIDALLTKYRAGEITIEDFRAYGAALDQLAERIAGLFVQGLRDTLTADEFAEMKRRNVFSPAGVCASHDFCDANIVMAEAFKSAGIEDTDPNDDAIAALWSTAWDLAMPELTDPASEA